jgi:hypothetical protein
VLTDRFLSEEHAMSPLLLIDLVRSMETDRRREASQQSRTVAATAERSAR